MLVEHTLTPDDVIAFSKYHLDRMRKRSRGGGNHAFITFLIAGGFAILLAMDALRNAGTVFIYVLLFLMGLGIVVWLLSRAAMPFSEGRLRRMLMSREGQKSLGQRRLTLSPHCLLLETEEGQEEIGWHQVSDVGVTPEYAFLYLDNEAVLIVPARAFSNDWQFEEFLTKIRDYHHGDHFSNLPESRRM